MHYGSYIIHQESSPESSSQSKLRAHSTVRCHSVGKRYSKGPKLLDTEEECGKAAAVEWQVSIDASF